ncbi:N-acetylglucosamine-6-phosphate deacetylase [Dongia sp.]|uniref:N-acetylglucosamine-6-phosphate deacetylase n=1 Tax=Dongia sp. TaxID=1977262 RepID=UPI00375049F3
MAPSGMATALIGATVFDGTRLRDGQAVLIEAGKITGVMPEAKLPKGVEKQAVSGLLAPGFIDVQVNGGGGVLFNETRTIAGIAAIGAAHRRFGTTGYLPTFITDTQASMAEAIKAADAAMQARTPGVLGIHLEGPFLNPERKGIHRADLMRSISDQDVAMIDLPAGGRVLVTLAPEKTEPATIAKLTKSGIIVAAGHTKADLATIRKAQGAGLTGITHLFNAMPPMMGREPGPVGAALEDRQLWCGLIVDLHHVSAVSLRVALAARGPERMMLVTDAMPSVGSAEDHFELLGEKIMRVDGALVNDAGTLAGSDLDMASAVRNTVRQLGVPVEDALRMASLNPAAFLRLDSELGRIALGYRADLVLLNDNYKVKATWISGARQDER